MEYIYAAMILHSADKDINEENVKSIIEAAGIDADDARIKALIAALEDVDIDEAMETTAMAAAPAAAAPAAHTCSPSTLPPAAAGHRSSACDRKRRCGVLRADGRGPL